MTVHKNVAHRTSKIKSIYHLFMEVLWGVGWWKMVIHPLTHILGEMVIFRHEGPDCSSNL